MKRTIRFNVFETNSSSTHSLTLGKLPTEQEAIDFQFETISIEPQHFGYSDIVAPTTSTNHFPEMNIVCGDCEHLNAKHGGYQCTNPEYDKYSYGRQCERHQAKQNEIMAQLIQEQSPDVRASALLTCIACVCENPAKIIHSYFDNLFRICKEVRYRDIKFEQKDNTPDYWKNAMFHGNWGDYNSQCWMETHSSNLSRDTVTEIATDTSKLKQYLFGAGAYAAGDRQG